MKIRLFIWLLCVPLIGLAAPDFTRFAFTLEVKDKNETYRSGTGCLVKSGTSIYYLTAHHIFSDMPDNERAALLKKISVVSETNGTIRFVPEAFVPVIAASDLTKTDLMVFKMKATPSMAAFTVMLAPEGLAQGDIAYLAARIPERRVATYPLKVITADSEGMEYEKIPGVDRYTGASGGPIFNAKGQLVGTYLGRRLMNAGQPEVRSLFGTPLGSITAVLAMEK
jgi:hypothetical protein